MLKLADVQIEWLNAVLGLEETLSLRIVSDLFMAMKLSCRVSTSAYPTIVIERWLDE